MNAQAAEVTNDQAGMLPGEEPIPPMEVAMDGACGALWEIARRSAAMLFLALRDYDKAGHETGRPQPPGSQVHVSLFLQQLARDAHVIMSGKVVLPCINNGEQNIEQHLA